MSTGAEKKGSLSSSTSRIVARGTIGNSEERELDRDFERTEATSPSAPSSASGDELAIDVEFEDEAQKSNSDAPPRTWRPNTGVDIKNSTRIVSNTRPKNPYERPSDTEPPPTINDSPKSFPETPVAMCGRYRLCFEIAQGGMATLFLARQEGPAGFDRVVALKRIHASMLDDPQFVEMFFDEARLASRISHPNVCGVVDFGEADGNHFIAMEYLLGQPLAAIRRRISADTELLARSVGPVLRIIADAAEGLHAAHELRDETGTLLNVVHRDISPPNILVTFDGNTKVLDFGIAKAANRVHKTSTGVLKGHLGYMSPEQMLGAPVDRRADIWALGVVLWELLTGRRLFEGSDFEILKAVSRGGDIAWPSRVRAGIAPVWDSIVMKALSRDPEARYATAREMSRDINRVLARMEEPVGMAEVGDWLCALFADERVRQLEGLNEARKG